MKKIFILMLVCAVLLPGCSSPSGDKKGTDASVDQTGTKTSEGSVYEEDQILFAAWDRVDVEGDSSKRYYYNYKGELLDGYEGKETIMPYYGEVGLAPALDRASWLYGYVDRDGVFQIEPQFTDASLFSDVGLAVVKAEVEINGEKDEKIGYIDVKGNLVVPCVYEIATGFYPCGYAWAIKDTGETYVEDYGEDSPAEYRYQEKTLYKYHILDEKGKIILELTSKELEIGGNTLPQGLYKDYFVLEDDFYNYKGEMILEAEKPEKGFSYEYEFREDAAYRYLYQGKGMGEGSLVKVEKFDGKKIVEQKMDYKIFSKRVATADSGFGWGIEAEGKTVIPFEYDYLHKQGSYFVCIKIGKNWSCKIDIFDESFVKTAEKLPYWYCIPSYDFNEFPDGYFLIQSEDDEENKVYGIIDFKGNIIVEPVFEATDVNVFSYEGMGFICY